MTPSLHLVATGLLLFLAQAMAGPAVAAGLEKQYSWFTLTSPTLAELDGELARKGPAIADTGQRHPGATRVEIQARVEYQPEARACRIASADVTVEARVTLPRWRPRRRPTEDDWLLWTTLFADIKRHEERHVDIAMNHARELEQSLRRLDRARDCARLAERAERLRALILEKHSAAQRRFDHIEAISFESRFDRLLDYRLQQIEKQEKSQ